MITQNQLINLQITVELDQADSVCLCRILQAEKPLSTQNQLDLWTKKPRSCSQSSVETELISPAICLSMTVRAQNDFKLAAQIASET